MPDCGACLASTHTACGHRSSSCGRLAVRSSRACCRRLSPSRRVLHQSSPVQVDARPRSPCRKPCRSQTSSKAATRAAIDVAQGCLSWMSWALQYTSVTILSSGVVAICRTLVRALYGPPSASRLWDASRAARLHQCMQFCGDCVYRLWASRTLLLFCVLISAKLGLRALSVPRLGTHSLLRT